MFTYAEGNKMKMQVWKAKLNAVFTEIYAENAEEVYDAHEMAKLAEKNYRRSVRNKSDRTLKKEMK